MTVTIIEFSELGRAEPGMAQIAEWPIIAKQTMVPTGSSSQSVAFNASTRFIRVDNDIATPIRVEVDFNPTASVSSGRMPTDSVEYFGVKPGMKLAVITTT